MQMTMKELNLDLRFKLGSDEFENHEYLKERKRFRHPKAKDETRGDVVNDPCYVAIQGNWNIYQQVSDMINFVRRANIDMDNLSEEEKEDLIRIIFDLKASILLSYSCAWYANAMIEQIRNHNETIMIIVADCYVQWHEKIDLLRNYLYDGSRFFVVERDALTNHENLQH